MKKLGDTILGLVIAVTAALVFLAPWLMDESELIAK
jgi:hypothetical protein